MQENQRIRLSKQLLRESLTGLLYEKDIHKVSVREICDRAQINRTTFYKYYGSQYDLLQDMENEVLSQIRTYLSEVDVVSEGGLAQVSKIIAFADENLELCRLLCNNTVGSEFPEKLITLPRIRELLTSTLNVGYSDAEAEYILGFIVNGGFSMIKNWINKDERESPEEMAALMISTIMKLFSV
jgi:AcrR family transcriptional regulator